MKPELTHWPSPGLSPPRRRRRRRMFRLLRGCLSLFVAIALVIGVKSVENRRDVVKIEPLALAVAAWTGVGDEFRILDPYAVEGIWSKTQLHTHTRHSLDSGRPIAEALAAYAEAGYRFVALTDHDVIVRPDEIPAGLELIPAEENTVSFPFWPLGQHAVFLFVEEHIARGSARERFREAADQGGLIAIAHPNWVGNLGLGRWEMRHLMAADGFSLMEVYNPHSDSSLDTAVWHETVVRRGPEAPVWAIAVDDAHGDDLFNLGWTMVKVEEASLATLKAALIRGSHYATTGPLVEFGVKDGAIWVEGEADGTFEVAFIRAAGDAVARHLGALPAHYIPDGSEGFVRVEVRSVETGRQAWSQPFWIVSAREVASP